MFIDFKKYIKSDTWAAISSAAIHHANGTCQCCLSAPATEVHHLTYYHNNTNITDKKTTPNLGTEQPWELLPVCRDCHQMITEGRIHIIAPVLYPSKTYPKISISGSVKDQPISILPPCFAHYFEKQEGCDGYFDIVLRRSKS